MKKIIISENKERMLFNALINEALTSYGDLVCLIKQYLDDNYFSGDMEAKNAYGEATRTRIAIGKDSRKQPNENDRLTEEQLFERLQYKFKTILGDKEERDKLLRQIINDWFSNSITKHGSLSKY